MSRRKPRPKPYDPRVWGSWLAVAAAWLAARLPLRLLLAAGQGIGLAAYRLARGRRHITEVNLALCFPELSAAERDRLAREAFRHAGVSLAEMIMVWLNPGRSPTPRFTLHGVEHLERARAEGRGVMLVAGHFACIDIASRPVSELIPVDVVYRKNNNPAWEWLQVYGRRHYFQQVIERDDTRSLLQALKRGHVVWYAADQDYGPKHSVFAPFFGIQAATITATARLARFNGSPVVLISQHRSLDDLTWEVCFHPPLEDFPSGDDVADATRLNQLIEDAIRIRPAQYLWAHRRFKTRPAGEARPYQRK